MQLPLDEAHRHMMAEALTIFLSVTPGLEQALCEEARALGFTDAAVTEGGVTLHGGWHDLWRAALSLRGASRILLRLGEFRALHLAQLDKRARKFAWGDVLKPGLAVSVDAVCKSSRIYHAGAARQRIAAALESFGAVVTGEASLTVKARIVDDLCTLSLDVTGEPLHKRGFKEEIGKAPMRETMAALFLSQMGYQGSEPVVDPMCGSGTFVIEAAEIAAGLLPGRARTFAFAQLPSFDAARFEALRKAAASRTPDLLFYGSDRDAGAIRMSAANAARAGVGEITRFTQGPVSEVLPPPGPKGLVICNPPYGGRIGERDSLKPLYRAFGDRMLVHFGGWRVGLITSDAQLAKATGLPLEAKGPPVLHGGLRIQLWRTPVLR